ESDNFRFCSRGNCQTSESLLQATERMRQDLARRWLGEGGGEQCWRPKCDIVLHATAAGYLRAAPGGQQTVGCSSIDAADGKIVRRRIDIRADQPGWFDAALGHELTHVVLADRFPDGRLPAWADEGMAVLADASTKQAAHLHDLQAAQSRRSTFRLAELFALNSYPAPERQAAFYGQSASLVRYLIGRGTPEQFVRFVDAAAGAGYEAAVRDVYRLHGVGDLERRWLRELNGVGGLAANDPARSR
ncbi:MAG TPA: hypothetical protein VFX03_03130, partial [Thermomicrobiales bacterium]|nr:hypothetical protein [Thermomicrobiales bacterium]